MGAIVVVDESEYFGLQVLHTAEGAACEQLAYQDREPDFDLIHPGTMIGGVMEDHLVGGITQERCTARHQGQDAIFAFLPQVLFDAGDLGHEADQGLRLMDGEVITDEMPACDLRIRSDDGLHMRQKIFLRWRGEPPIFPSPHHD